MRSSRWVSMLLRTSLEFLSAQVYFLGLLPIELCMAENEIPFLTLILQKNPIIWNWYTILPDILLLQKVDTIFLYGILICSSNTRHCYRLYPLNFWTDPNENTWIFPQAYPVSASKPPLLFLSVWWNATPNSNELHQKAFFISYWCSNYPPKHRWWWLKYWGLVPLWFVNLVWGTLSKIKCPSSEESWKQLDWL